MPPRPKRGVRIRTKCLFCGLLQPMTGEHVFSRWTHKYLGERKRGKAVRLVATQYENYSILKAQYKHAGQVRDWKIYCVCGRDASSCNNGWMRELENKVKHVMEKLIKGEAIRINIEDQKNIACWAVMKVMVAEQDEEYITTHYTHRRYLMVNKQPPAYGYGVWIGCFERKEWCIEWMSRPLSIIANDKLPRKRSADGSPSYHNTKATTQVVGKLFIHVIHSPMRSLIPRWHFSTPDGGVIFRIWPPSDFSIRWPSSPLSDRDADCIANALAEFARLCV